MYKSSIYSFCSLLILELNATFICLYLLFNTLFIMFSNIYNAHKSFYKTAFANRLKKLDSLRQSSCGIDFYEHSLILKNNIVLLLKTLHTYSHDPESNLELRTQFLIIKPIICSFLSFKKGSIEA